MTARRVARLVTSVALVASGGYALVYLYRWEWNRAIVAGIFFLAAEVALVGSTMLRRLSDLEQRVAEVNRSPGARPAPPAAVPMPAADVAYVDQVVDPEVLERLRESAPDPARRFEWLDPQQGNLGVFVPVLLGAGAMLSGIAYVVEKVAGATARPAMERGLASQLGALALPAGGLVGAGPVPLHVDVARGSARRRATRAVAAFVATVALWSGVDALADLTQDRPSVYDASQATVVDLDFAFRGGGDVAAATDTLWATCRVTLPDHIRAVELASTGPASSRLVVNPALGEHAVRRFRGCLADLNLNRMVVSVGNLRHVPFSAAPAVAPATGS